MNLIEQADPHVVAIFGADHIYRMNIRQMIEYHVEKHSTVTVAAIPVKREFASEFGVIETTPEGKYHRFSREEGRCSHHAR